MCRPNCDVEIIFPTPNVDAVVGTIWHTQTQLEISVFGDDGLVTGERIAGGDVVTCRDSTEVATAENKDVSEEKQQLGLF